MLPGKHKNKKDKDVKHEHTENEATQNTSGALDEAQKDIEQDPDLSVHNPNDDLDEGETARLGDDKTDLV
jgi:hypothetical protein